MKWLRDLIAKTGASRKWMAVIAYSILCILADQGVLEVDTVDQIFYAIAAIVGVEGAADIVSRVKGGNGTS